MVYITDPVIYTRKWYIYNQKIGEILLGSLNQLVVAVGEWVSIVKFLAVSFVVNAQQVSVILFTLVQVVICRGFFFTSFGRRNTVFFGKTYRLAQSSFRSFRHFIVI